MVPAAGVGLALSGGAIRGIAHIAVLQVLEEEGIPVESIAGTSAGSLVGALYAAGIPLGEIEEHALDGGWKRIFLPTIPKRGLISSDRIASYVDRLLPVKRFSELKMPFAAVATELRTGRKITLHSGSVSRAVQASCSLPVVFSPTVIGGENLVDGGVASMVPVRTARRELRARRVVAVNVNAKEEGPQRYDNLFKIAVQVSSLWATRNAREESALADVLIPVSARGIGLHDVRKARELLRRGRKAARSKVREIRALLQQARGPRGQGAAGGRTMKPRNRREKEQKGV